MVLLLAATLGALNLPDHPRLLLAADQVPEIKARAAANPALGERLKGLLRSADARVAKPVALPDRGGQWPHYYVCKQDGGDLKTVSPTQHRCPLCGTVYTGYPYDDVVILFEHGRWANGLRELGLAYVLTGEARYAAKAKEILLAYAAKYPGYALHNNRGEAKTGGGKVGPQTLDESVWLITFCQGADLVWNALSAAEQQRVAEQVVRPAADVIRHHKMGIHNIQCWKNSAVGLAGLLLDDEELVRDAVDSEHGFKQQVAKGVNLDGQWYEGAWGYHFYTMSALSGLAEAGAHCGLKLYEFEQDGRGYRRLFEGPLNLSMPNLVLPNFNDSGYVGVTGNSLYELALRRYGDPRFAEVLRPSKQDSLEALLVGVRPLPTAPARAVASRNAPDGGYAILQSGEGATATWVCLKYGPHGGGHGHPDKLNVLSWRHGQVFGFDPGTGKYAAPIHNAWQKTTVAHNTLVVDETDQAPATGACLAFVTEPGWSGALASAGPIYRGVDYRRAVALVGGDLLLVLDLVSAEAPHRFDLAFHNAQSWATAPAGERVGKLGEKNGYGYLADLVKVNGPLPLVANDTQRLGWAVTSLEPGETLAGTGPSSTTRDHIPCVLRRVQGRTATVGWAMSLAGTVPTVALSRDGEAVVLAATVGGQTVQLRVAGRDSHAVDTRPLQCYTRIDGR